MERLTRPNLNVNPDTDRFLRAAIGGKEIDWKQSRDTKLNVLINGPTSNGFGKDIFRKMARDLYGQLKTYEDIAELCGGFDRLRELAEADKDGRYVVLPCKVGDKVYCLDRGKSIEAKVISYTVDETGAWMFTVEIYDQKADTSYYRVMETAKIGKTVFLTREEAERALEGRKDG